MYVNNYIMHTHNVQLLNKKTMKNSMAHKVKTDVDRYKELKKKLNPNNDPFIIMENTPEWKEFNYLTIKLMPLLTMNLI